MKKFTKGLMTLALLALGVSNANAGTETVIKSVDYTTNPVLIDGSAFESEGYPFYRMGDAGGTASYDVKKGEEETEYALVINNTSDDGNAWDLQPFIIDWFTVQKKYDYKVVITYMSDVAGKVNISFGNWDASMPKYDVEIEETDEYKDLVVEFNEATFASEGNNHVLFQCRKLVGTVKIKKVEVIEIEPDEPIREPEWTEILINGDLTGTDMSCFYSKEYPSGVVKPANVVDGVIVVESAAKVTDDWDSQFWIRLPQALPAGKEYKVSFEYKASSAQECGTQTHREPGDYKTWQSLGNIKFDTDWKTFDNDDKAFTSPSDGDGNLHSIAFNLSKGEDVTYYFRNFSLKIDKIDIVDNDFPAAVSVPCAVSSTGWASFANSENVVFGKAKAYGAKYDKESGSVKLAEIDQLPAGEGALITTGGPTALYQFAKADEATSSIDNNLKAGPATSDGTFYALTTNGLGEVGFAKVQAGVEIPDGKAYLEISAPAREFIGLFETTGIKTVGVAESNEVIFNLAGQRMMKAQKGVNIINGKKLFVK